MDKNINIDHEMIEYILSHTKNLHPVQKELIKFNENLVNLLNTTVYINGIINIIIRVDFNWKAKIINKLIKKKFL